MKKKIYHFFMYNSNYEKSQMSFRHFLVMTWMCKNGCLIKHVIFI